MFPSGVIAEETVEVDFCSSLTLKDSRDTWNFTASELLYGPGVRLYEQGYPPEDVYHICSGLVKLTTLDARGRELIACLQGEGWVLGASAAVLQKSYETSAITLTSCRLQRILGKDLRNLIKTNPDISWRIHEMHSREVRLQSERLAALGTQSARARLIQLLSQLINENGLQPSAGKWILKAPLKQWEFAQLLAITPGHVNRLLRALEKEGTVRRHKSAIILSNLEKLTEGINRTDTSASLSQ